MTMLGLYLFSTQPSKNGSKSADHRTNQQSQRGWVVRTYRCEK